MSQLQTDAQKKEARKQQAMRMTVTKVKPVVVKHVLNNQVMSIYDLKTHMEKDYMQSLERDTRQPSLPQHLTGTSHGNTSSPYGQHVSAST
jgi:hypothetical protein